MEKNISLKLKKAIEDSGLTHAEIEKLSGVPRSAIQRYAAGDTDKIPVDRLLKIADVCKSSISDILELEDPQKSHYIPPFENFQFIIDNINSISNDDIRDIEDSLKEAITYYSDLSERLHSVLEETNDLIEKYKEDAHIVTDILKSFPDMEKTDLDKFIKLSNLIVSSEESIEHLNKAKKGENKAQSIQEELEYVNALLGNIFSFIGEAKEVPELERKIAFLHGRGIHSLGESKLENLNIDQINSLITLYSDIYNGHIPIYSDHTE